MKISRARRERLPKDHGVNTFGSQVSLDNVKRDYSWSFNGVRGDSNFHVLTNTGT